MSLDESTPESVQCSIHYEHCRQMMLRAYDWGFARRVVKLALLDSDSAKWDYVFAYPSRCLCIRRVYNEDIARLSEYENQYDVAAISENTRAILSNIESAYCEYTADATDVDVYSPEFVDGLARLLASSIGFTLTGDSSLVTFNYQMFQAVIKTAKLQDAQERHINTRWSGRYEEERFR